LREGECWCAGRILGPEVETEPVRGDRPLVRVRAGGGEAGRRRCRDQQDRQSECLQAPPLHLAPRFRGATGPRLNVLPQLLKLLMCTPSRSGVM